MKIAIGNDHLGLDLKNRIKKLPHEWVDFGCDTEEMCNYVDYAIRVARAVSNDKVEHGILICGSGVGMSIVANKVSGVRAVLCQTNYIALMSRRHNDANVLCLGGTLHPTLAFMIVKNWIEEKFEGGKHRERLVKIKELEEGWKEETF